MTARRPTGTEGRAVGAPSVLAAFTVLAAACSSGEPAQDAGDAVEVEAAADEGAAREGDAQDRAPRSASHAIMDLEGNDVGTLELEDGGRGLLVRVRVAGLSPGAHGFHLHETGRCEPPFESAGGHHAPLGRTHGFLTDDGPHVGDLPNLHVGAEETTTAHAYAAGLRLDDLRDEDGSALIIHAGPDDYATEPAGAAGERVACAAITSD